MICSGEYKPFSQSQYGYNLTIASDIMGPEKQNAIFPQKKKGHKGTRNVGSGPGGRLTYDEFQWRANKGTLGTVLGLCSCDGK